MATDVNDLKLYYSGALENEGVQDQSIISLGGFRSSVQIPNNLEDNLFEEVGINEARNGIVVYRSIFLMNVNSSESMNDLSLYIEGKRDFEKIEFAKKTPDENGAIQRIPNQFSEPYNLIWYETYNEQEKVVLDVLFNSGDVLGLWFKRTIDPTTQNNINSELKFHFSWT